MSTIVAIVKSLVGQVFAVSLDGLKRQIFEGERVLQGEQVLTGLGGEVTLQLANGEVLSVAQNSNWQAGQAEPADSTQAPASELEQAIAAGLDPTTELEATAAGAGTGGGTGGAAGGGHSFVMLDETGQQLEATVGFETAGLAFATGEQDEELGELATTDTAAEIGEPEEPGEPSINTAPTAQADAFTINEDGTVSIDVLSNDSDLDGDALTITAVDGQAIAEGTSVSVNNGTVTLTNGQLVFTPDANYNGPANFSYTISDGVASSTASITGTVAAVNDAPVAVDDSLVASEDTAVTYSATDLLGNDSDVDGDTLTIASVTSGTGGTAVLNADGTVTFTPNANFNGVADFSYTVTDGTLISNTATVTVNVAAVNDPVVANDDSFSVNEDGSVSLNLLGNDSAADGGLSIQSINGTALIGGVQAIAVANGVVNVAADGSLTFVPAANFNGTISFDYVAQDIDGDTDTASVSINVDAVNDAPTGTDGTITLNEDSSHSFSADDFGFTDADLGDSLQAVRIDSLPTAGSLQLNGAAVNAGQVIALADLGNLTFRPAADASGDNYSALTFSVSDQAGQFALAPSTLSFDVTPVADAPIVTIELGAGSISTTTITTANVTTSGQGFSVSAINLDGTPGVISINDSPVGFGVVGDASGANNELGQSGNQSERIVVDFDAPVASATVSFAWLHTGERATYNLFDSAGNSIGSGTIAGLTDIVDPAITLTSDNGTAISRIEFSAPNGGDNDYLINSIEFVSSIDYPLTITATPTDIDYSESIASITVEVPAGATLSVGTLNIDGTWTLPLGNVVGNDSYSVTVNPITKAVTITGLEMTIPGNPVGSLSVTVTATAQDGADTESTSTTITLGDTDAPETNAVAVVTNEDVPVVVNLSATDASSSIANFTITSLPTNGTLIYNGQEVLVGQVIPAIGNQASLSFAPNANWNGSTEFQYLASDVAGNVDQTPASVNIQVNAINDAPVNQLPAGYTTDEDVTLKLSGLSVSDVDVASGLISVTLTVARGTITAADAGGVSVTGSGSGSLQLSGTLADINAYLADTATQPSYIPVADDSGSVTLTMTSNDGGNTGAGGALTDSDNITITINPVADAVPGSDVSLVIGTPVVNTINLSSGSSGLAGLSSYTLQNGITLSTGNPNTPFSWTNGSKLAITSGGGDNRIEGSDAITMTFPSGMQYMAMGLKNASDDSLLVRSRLEVGDLTSGNLSGTITSTGGSFSSSSLKVNLVLEVVNGGTTSTVTLVATVNPGGTWSVSYNGVSGTITKATVESYIDGSKFNQGGNGSANFTYSISSDMQSMSISQDTSNTYSQSNNGFQIDYIALDASPTGLTSYTYPVDLYAVVQDTIGTAEAFTGLALSDLPAGTTLSVVRADGSYQEITPNAQGEYDLSAYTALLNTPTTTSGTDKLYLVTVEALPSGFVPTLTVEVSDGGSSSAKTIIGGSASSTLTGGAGNDYIDGGAGNDFLIGGEGDDILLGGSGADTFVWQAGHSGNDVIKDFNSSAGDRIDLRDLLQGEESTSDITQYLRVDTATSTLLISSTGVLNADASNADVSIKLENNGTPVNLNPGNLSPSDLVNSLIAGADPMIKTDHI